MIVLPYFPIASKFHTAKDGIKSIRRRYNLPPKYFLISNQFWLHKNHLLAFEAFNQLYKMGYNDIFLVCTGKMEDYRNTNYVQNLLQKLKRLECAKNVLLLGLIPKRDQLCIMRNAIALIQPTHFEGGPGGGAVYDAISMQVPCIVSDIDVNREIPKSKRICYFDVNSSEDLSNKMELTIERNFQKVSKRIMTKVQSHNIRKYADFLYGVMDEVIAESSRDRSKRI